LLAASDRNDRIAEIPEPHARQAMMSPSYERAMILAALSGSKIALGPAFLATARHGPSRGAWVAAAIGEMTLDKLGVFPARFRPALLIPHTLAGAWTARESLKDDGVDDPKGALIGAIVAAGVACVAPLIRIAASKGLGVPDALLGAAEDYLVLRLGADALDIPMDQLPAIAREAIEEVGHRLQPALESVGIGS
jgi:hypothetical protein